MRTLRHAALIRAIIFTAIFSLLWLQIGPAWASVSQQAFQSRDLVRRRLEAARRASGLAPGLTQTPGAALRCKIEARQRQAQIQVAVHVSSARSLSSTEMRQALGRGAGRNPYFAGSPMPWQKSFRDVNLCTGNLFKSFTDIQVAPSRGAGLVLQRTYNSNDARVGPFGVGWTHAYDIRIQEAADVQKEAGNSSAVSVQLVSGAGQNGTAGQAGGADTVNEVPRTDFFGAKHTYHRDADGLYSPPAYLYDETSSEYSASLDNGPVQVDSDTEKGMDGTVKHYVNVVTRADGSSGNERACDYIEDRYGNRTTLAYGQSYAQPAGSDQPAATRKLLTQVTNPTGRALTFYWTNFGTSSQPAYRITQIDSPTDPATGSPAYRVVYGYYLNASDAGSGGIAFQLKSVTLDPDGLNRTTTYTYTSQSGPDPNDSSQTFTENGLLSSIIDPLGHVVFYTYATSYNYTGCLIPGTESDAIDPSQQNIQGVTPTGTVWAYQVTEPAGVDTSRNLRTHTWTIIPGRLGYFGEDYPITRPLDPSAAFYTYVTDSQRFNEETFTQNYLSLGVNTMNWYATLGGYYHYFYDSQNNIVERDKLATFGGLAQAPTFGPVLNRNNFETYTYGPHGNQTVDQPFGIYFPNFPKTTTTYYNASQYFQKQSITDRDNNITVMGVGKNTAGTSGDPDPNVGDRGQTLWVQDAGYNDSVSPSYHKQFTYTYNQYGQKLSETNLNGTVTRYYYGGDGSSYALADTDAADTGDLIAVVQDPGDSTRLNRTTTMHYDVMGRVLQSIDPKGQETDFIYNSLGQPLTVTSKNASGVAQEIISYVYGANGRTENVTDNRGTTLMAYEPGCDRVSSVTDPVTGTLFYTYGLTGERLTMTLPGGGTWKYLYAQQDVDPASQSAYARLHTYTLPTDDLEKFQRTLVAIIDDQGRRVDFAPDSDGYVEMVRQNETFDSNGTMVSFDIMQTAPDWEGDPGTITFERLAQMTTTWYGQNANNQSVHRIVSENDYTYDDAGQRLTNTVSKQVVDANGNGVTQTDNYNQVTPLLTSRTEQYAYDDLNRLKTVDYGDGQTQGYTFDAMGNRLQKTDSVAGSTTYAFDAANRLATMNGQTVASDADGNTLTDASGRTNVWDSQNRMTSCKMNGVTSTCTYGADGLRRTSTVNGTTTYYIYDGQMLVREMQKNAQGNLQSTATYLQGPRGPEYRRDDVHSEGTYTDGTGTHPAGKTRWYVYDGLGSVVGEVDPSGSMTSTGAYDVYGAKRTGGTGTATSRQGFVGALGHVTDTETGLVYMRARYYDPNVGRFVSEDPSKNENNWFAYCSNNPINKVDLNGRADLWADFALKSILDTIISQLGLSGVELPDDPATKIEDVAQAARNMMYSGRAAATGGAIDAAEGDATDNDAESAEGNIKAGSGLAESAVASATYEQSEEFLQFIVDMNDIIGP